MTDPHARPYWRGTAQHNIDEMQYILLTGQRVLTLDDRERLNAMLNEMKLIRAEYDQRISELRAADTARPQTVDLSDRDIAALAIGIARRMLEYREPPAKKCWARAFQRGRWMYCNLLPHQGGEHQYVETSSGDPHTEWKNHYVPIFQGDQVTIQVRCGVIREETGLQCTLAAGHPGDKTDRFNGHKFNGHAATAPGDTVTVAAADIGPIDEPEPEPVYVWTAECDQGHGMIRGSGTHMTDGVRMAQAHFTTYGHILPITEMDTGQSVIYHDGRITRGTY